MEIGNLKGKQRREVLDLPSPKLSPPPLPPQQPLSFSLCISENTAPLLHLFQFAVCKKADRNIHCIAAHVGLMNLTGPERVLISRSGSRTSIDGGRVMHRCYLLVEKG